MSEREKPTGTDDEMRSLPDGGLSDAMPDWLRRPPAWRDLPRKDEPATAKALPEPDTSIIDPRELITVDDLPQWLRDLAARETEPAPADTPTPAHPEDQTAAPALTSRLAPEAETVELPASSATIPAARTAAWIWAMRAAIILTILAIIYYVFIW